MNRKAQKPRSSKDILEESIKKSCYDKDTEWIEHINVEINRAHGRTRKRRLMQRLIDGRAVKPCGYECHEWGLVIINTLNHESMRNASELMNDKEFILKAMKKTPSPKSVNSFFYRYVNEYLKKDKSFRLEILKALFTNEYVLLQEDIEWFVQEYCYQAEYEILKNDIQFQQYLRDNFTPTMIMPEELTRWNNIDEKNEKRRYRKSVTRIHNENQARFDDMMSCFATEKTEDKDDDLEGFFYDTPLIDMEF